LIFEVRKGRKEKKGARNRDDRGKKEKAIARISENRAGGKTGHK
jgi:hypothetical protein